MLKMEVLAGENIRNAIDQAQLKADKVVLQNPCLFNVGNVVIS